MPYITTDFPDKKAKIWWYHLQDVLMENEKLKMNGVEYDCSDMRKKNRAFEALSNVFTSSADPKNIQKTLDHLFNENDCSARRDLTKLLLSWEQIVDLAKDPLCTIGAHTVSHSSLPELNDEKIRKELSEGNEKIGDKIKKSVKHFAYPYGFWDNRVAGLVMEQYSTAVLFWPDGMVRRGDSSDRLHRIALIMQ